MSKAGREKNTKNKAKHSKLMAQKKNKKKQEEIASKKNNESTLTDSETKS